MESLLGFNEALSEDVVEAKSQGFKVVPWMSWDEWKSVRQSLFSSSSDRVAFALRRVATWRSRGCIPVAIDITASVVEIQQKDTYFRNNTNESLSTSDEMLAMLYCMAVMRLVNAVVEKTRKKNEISIGEAADAIGIPRMLIDIRHEGSHRDLPSLRLLRLASTKALDWLVSYYWEPQERVIPIQNEQAANLRKEIRRRLHEVAQCLKAKQMDKSKSSHIKEKRVRQTETLCGRNKFLFHVAGKSSHSNSVGLKKQLAKSLRNILRLYASSSPEVVYALLDYMLIALDWSKSSEKLEDLQSSDSTGSKHTAFDYWKSVVLKLTGKEPEFILTLTQAVLERMETEETTSYGTDGPQSSVDSVKSRHVELLPCLFDCLIGSIKMHKKESKTGKPLSNAMILGLLRRCLLLSYTGNKHLLSSAVTLAQMTGDTSLLHKLKKLALLDGWNPEGDSVESCYDKILLSEHKHSLQEAEEKFEVFRKRCMQKKEGKPKQPQAGHNSRWAVAKSWNPCPIGMLPETIGFSGRLPILDCVDQCGANTTVLSSKDYSQLNQCGKRAAEDGTEEMDCTPVKKMKETEADYVTPPDQTDTDAEGFKGHMMIDGVWKKVREEEMLALASAVRLLV